MFLVKHKSCSCACDLYHEWNKINEIGHMGHVREYTAKEVQEFMEKIGFKLQKIEYSGQTNGGIKAKLFNIIEKIIPSLRPNMRLVFEK